jgi:hypothetical protein
MTCDEFLAAMETGSRVQRWQARRHAARCPSCAAAMQMMETVKGELAEAEPLTAGMRARWLSVARETPRLESAWRWRVAYAMAAMVLVAVATWWAVHRVAVNKPPEIVKVKVGPSSSEAGQIVAVKVEPAQQFEMLQAELDQLGHEIGVVRQAAVSLAAMQEISRVLDKYRGG